MWNMSREKTAENPAVVSNFEVEEFVHDDVILEGVGFIEQIRSAAVKEKLLVFEERIAVSTTGNFASTVPSTPSGRLSTIRP